MDYLPPDHIRFLHIEAGSDDEPMCCSVETTDLQTSQAHESLCYSLGSLEIELGVEQEDLWGRKKRLRIMKDIFIKASHVVI
jgi:hypothetical protein